MGVIALDIGGVNTKAVWRHRDAVRAVLRPYDVVREPGALTALVRDVIAGLGPAPAEIVALTMTAGSGPVPYEARGRRLRARRGRGRGRGTGSWCSQPRASSWASPRHALAAGRCRRRLGGERDRRPCAPLGRADDRRGQHDGRCHPHRGRPSRRHRPFRPRSPPGGRARLHRCSAHEPRGHRSTGSRARGVVPGRLRAVRDQRRRACDPRAPRTGGLRLSHAGRATGERRLRPRARRAPGLRGRGAARRPRGRDDRRISARRAGAPGRGGGAAGEQALPGTPAADRGARERRVHRVRGGRAPRPPGARDAMERGGARRGPRGRARRARGRRAARSC